MAATTNKVRISITQHRKHKNGATTDLKAYVEKHSVDTRKTIVQNGKHLLELISAIWPLLCDGHRCNPEKLKFSSDEQRRKEDTEPFLIWCIWGTANGGENIMTFSVTQEAD